MARMSQNLVENSGKTKQDIDIDPARAPYIRVLWVLAAEVAGMRENLEKIGIAAPVMATNEAGTRGSCPKPAGKWPPHPVTPTRHEG